jgi:small redox-active disulfide protein 2
MKIEILGSGCAKCKALEERVREAVKKAGISATISHVTDIEKIIEMNVSSTPALAVDGKVVLSGYLPSISELVEMLKGD